MSLAASLPFLGALFAPPAIALLIPRCRTDKHRVIELGAIVTLLGVLSQGLVSDWTVHLVALAVLTYAVTRLGVVRCAPRSGTDKPLLPGEPLLGIGACAVCLLVQRDDPGTIFRSLNAVYLLAWPIMGLHSRNLTIFVCLVALLNHLPRTADSELPKQRSSTELRRNSGLDLASRAATVRAT